jgi:glycogen synthase
MSEMLDEGKAGLLVPPRTPRAIAAAVSLLLGDQSRRMRLGRAARERLLSVYCDDRVGILQESSYQRAIARRRRLGAR